MLIPEAIESSILRNPVTISPAMTLQGVIRELDHWPPSCRCDGWLVLENDQVVGMLTERDIIEALVHHRSLEAVTVAEVLHPLQSSLRPGELTDSPRLIRKLQQNCCPSLPLLDEQGHLLGLITRDNLLQALDPDNASNTLAARRLRDSQRLAQVGSWELDLRNNVLYWSEAVFQLFEIDPTQFGASYEAFLQLVHPEDRERVHEAFTQHLNNGLPYHIVHRLLMPDGRRKYLQEQCETLYTEAGVPYLCQGTVQDITQLTEAEQKLQQFNAELEVQVKERTEALVAQNRRYQALMSELRQREAHLRAAQRIAQVGSWIFDVGTGQITWSEEVFQIFGRSLSLGPPTFEEIQHSLHPEDRCLHQETMENAIRQGQPYDIECRFYRPDGSLGYFLARGEPLLDGAGNVVQLIGTVLDLTARKAAELALQAKSEEVDRFFSLSLDLMFIGTLDGRILRVNSQWTKALGYEVAELEGNDFMNYVHPDDWQKTKETNAELMKHRAITGFINRYRHRDGSYRWFDWQAVISEDKVFAIARDITERIEEEALRRQRRERERLLAEISQHIRQSLDLHQIFETACQEIRPVIGVDRVGIFQFSPDSGWEEGEFVAESLGVGILSITHTIIRDHCFGARYAALYQQGRYAAIDNIYQLEQCYTNFLALIQVRANLVIPLLCGGQLWGLLCLHQCHHTRHWQAEEIDFCQHLANQLAIAIQQAGLVKQLEQELQERQRAQELLRNSNRQLAQANQELTRANRLKDEFLANTSHELRTPLNAILGMTESFQEGLFGMTNPKQRKALETIERSSTHLLSLINDILDLAKIEAGHLVLDQVLTPVIPLCQSSLAFVEHQASQKGLALEAKFPSGVPDLWVDERRIRQVLINLLNNAVKFTPPGGRITLAVSHLPPPLASTAGEGISRVRVYRQPQETKEHFLQTENIPLSDFVRITVQDTGIGISDQDVQMLFQPFIQVDSDLNRQYEGTGLGLALVKRLVEFHGGRVNLTSEVGVGSCFSIDLPCVSRPALQSPVVGVETVKTPMAREQPPLLLLAEDNTANALTMAGYLKAKGYRVLSAKDGREALDLAAAHQPDVVVMDIQMPFISGLEAIQQIRAHPNLAQTPIIALTALATESNRASCLAAGANEYVSKPVKLKELLALIEALLRGSE